MPILVFVGLYAYVFVDVRECGYACMYTPVQK